MPRMSQAGQEAALADFGIDTEKIYVEGRGPESLEALTRSLRKGEAVAVTRLHLLAPPKIKTSDRPRRALWGAIAAIEAKGGHVIEVESGRSTANKSDRDAMIADAIEALTHAGRSPRRRDGKGRPPLAFTAEEIEFARREWYDIRHRTNEAALAAIRKRVPKWTLTRCYKTQGFGPSGRSK